MLCQRGKRDTIWLLTACDPIEGQEACEPCNIIGVGEGMVQERNHRQKDQHCRRQDHGTGAQRRPTDAPAEQLHQHARQGNEYAYHGKTRLPDHIPLDLAQTAAVPPQQAPHQQDDGYIALCLIYFVTRAVQGVAGKQGRERDQERADIMRVQYWQSADAVAVDVKECTGREYQQQTEQACAQTLLARTHPQDTGALHRPGGGCPAPVKRQRYRECGEDHAQRQECLDQQSQRLRRALEECAGQGEIKETERQRRPRQAVLDIAHQRGLQQRGHNRHTEHQAAVDVTAQVRRLAQRVQHGDGDIHEEKQNQEWLGADKKFRAIGTITPERADHEGETEPDQVQHSPGAEPAQQQDAGIEQGVIAEQHDVIAGAGGGKNRREETAGDAEHRECQRRLA